MPASSPYSAPASTPSGDGALSLTSPRSMPLLRMSPAELKNVKRFRFDQMREMEGRVEIWEEPTPDGLYIIGADTAFGIQGRDYDAACVLCKHPGPIRQVAEIHGHYGDKFDRALYALCMYYREAFLLVERATLGLAILKRLYHEYYYRYLYYERREESKLRQHTDNLGIPPTGNDLILWDFRRAVLDLAVILRSRALLEQMSKLQFRESVESPTGRRQDSDLKVILSGGGSPDLVMAAAYAWFASTQVQHFEKPPPPLGPNTLGHLLGHETTFDRPRHGGNTWVRRKGK